METDVLETDSSEKIESEISRNEAQDSKDLLTKSESKSAVALDEHKDMETDTQMEKDNLEIGLNEKIEAERDTGETFKSKAEEPVAPVNPLNENKMEQSVVGVDTNNEICVKMEIDSGEEIEAARETNKSDKSNLAQQSGSCEDLSTDKESKQSPVSVAEKEIFIKMEPDNADTDSSVMVVEARETNRSDNITIQQAGSQPDILTANQSKQLAITVDRNNDNETCSKLEMDDLKTINTELYKTKEQETDNNDFSKTQDKLLKKIETKQSVATSDITYNIGDKMSNARTNRDTLSKVKVANMPGENQAPEGDISLQMDCEEIEPEHITSDDDCEMLGADKQDKMNKSNELQQQILDVLQSNKTALKAPILVRKPYFFMMIPTKIKMGILQEHMRMVGTKVKNMSLDEVPVWIVQATGPITEKTLESGEEIGLTMSRIDFEEKDMANLKPSYNRHKYPVAPFDFKVVKPLRDAFTKRTGIIIFDNSLNHVYVDEIVKAECDKLHIKEVVRKSGRIQMPVIAVLASMPVKVLRRKTKDESEVCTEQLASKKASPVPKKASPVPSKKPSPAPSEKPSPVPSKKPSPVPSKKPSHMPSKKQSLLPSKKLPLLPVFETKTPIPKKREILLAPTPVVQNAKVLIPLLTSQGSYQCLMPFYKPSEGEHNYADTRLTKPVYVSSVGELRYANPTSHNSNTSPSVQEEKSIKIETMAVKTEKSSQSSRQHNFDSQSDKNKIKHAAVDADNNKDEKQATVVVLDKRTKKQASFVVLDNRTDKKQASVDVDNSEDKKQALVVVMDNKMNKKQASFVVIDNRTDKKQASAVMGKNKDMRQTSVSVMDTSKDKKDAELEKEAIKDQRNSSSITDKIPSVTVENVTQNIDEIDNNENETTSNMSKGVTSKTVDENGHAKDEQIIKRLNDGQKMPVLVSATGVWANWEKTESALSETTVHRTVSKSSEASEQSSSGTVVNNIKTKNAETTSSFSREQCVNVSNSVSEDTETYDETASVNEEPELPKEHFCYCCGRNIILCNIYSSELRKEGFPKILEKYTGARKIKRKEGHICMVCRSQVVEIHRRMKIFRTKYKAHAQRIGRKVFKFSKEKESSTENATKLSEELESSSDEEAIDDIQVDDTQTQTEPNITGCYCNSNKDKNTCNKEQNIKNKVQRIYIGPKKLSSSSLGAVRTDSVKTKKSKKLMQVFRKDPSTGILHPELTNVEPDVAIRAALEKHVLKSTEKKKEVKTKSVESGVAIYSSSKKILYQPSDIKENERMKKLTKGEMNKDNDIDSEEDENCMPSLTGDSKNDLNKNNGVEVSGKGKKAKTETESNKDGSGAVDRVEIKAGTKTLSETSAKTKQGGRLGTSDKGGPNTKKGQNADGVENKTSQDAKILGSKIDHTYSSAPLPGHSIPEDSEMKIKDIKKMLYSVRYNTTCGADLPYIVLSCCGHQVPAADICNNLMKSQYMREKFEDQLINEVRSKACLFHQKSSTKPSVLVKKGHNDVVNMNWLDIVHELFITFPVLAKMIAALTELVTKKLDTVLPQIAIVYAVLMYARDKRFGLVQYHLAGALLEHQLSTEKLFDSFVRTGLSLSYQTASKLVKTPDCPFNAEKILELREDKRQMQHERRRQYYARLRELKKGAKEENADRGADGEPTAGTSTGNQSGSKSKNRKRPAGSGNQSGTKLLKLENGKVISVSKLAPNVLMKHFGQSIIKDQKKMLLSKYKPLMRIVKSPGKRRRKQKRNDQQTDEQASKRVCLIQTPGQPVKVAHVTESDLVELVRKQNDNMNKQQTRENGETKQQFGENKQQFGENKQQTGETSQAVQELLSSEKTASTSESTSTRNIINVDKDTYESFLNKMSLANNDVAENKKSSPKKKDMSTSTSESPSKDPSIRRVNLLTPEDLVQFQIAYSSDFIASPPTDLLDLMDPHYIPDDSFHLYDEFAFDICDSDVKDSVAADAVFTNLINMGKNYEERVKTYPEEYPASKQAIEWLQAVGKIIVRYKLELSIGRDEIVQLMKAFMAYCGVGNYTILPRQMRVQEAKLMSEPTACYRVVNAAGKYKSLIIVEVHERQCYGAEADTQEQTLFEKLAGELLLEMPYTFFFPYSFALVFLKTTVMVARLQISRPHLKKLQTNSTLQPKDQATIIYTQCYDLLRKRDRLKMMRFLSRLDNGAKSLISEKQKLVEAKKKDLETKKAAEQMFEEMQ